MINILDVSNIVYSGHYGSVARSTPRTVCGFPVGGLFKLFGLIASNMSSCDFVVAFDGDRILKKELLPEYKANRMPQYSVYAEIELAKELFAMCNIPILYSPEYEADDYIYSTCHYITYLSNDREKLTVYSDDRDLACCITPNISLCNVTTQGKFINFENYSDRVVGKVKIPYNSILLYKLFNGDSSDNYKGSHFTGITFDTLFSELDTGLRPLIEDGLAYEIHYSNYDVLSTVVNSMPYIQEDVKEQILKRARIVYPYLVSPSGCNIQELKYRCNSGELKYYNTYDKLGVFGQQSMNTQKFYSICKTLGVPFRGSANVDKDKELMDLLYLRGQELSSGDFMVRKAAHKPHVTETKPLLTMEFPDDLSEG